MPRLAGERGLMRGRGGAMERGSLMVLRRSFTEFIRAPDEGELAGGCHDFERLAKRWAAVADRAGLAPREIGRHDGLPLLALERPGASGGPLVYLSAGIHGDEPGGTEGLLLWAQERLGAWPEAGFVILPCLNPFGLIHNLRTDAAGRDLNRGWQRPDTPVAGAVRRFAGGRRFDLALTLHEDFDAAGVYVYEPLGGGRRAPWGERLLEAAPLAADPRGVIDGSRSRGGVIRRRITKGTLPEWPEAVWLLLERAGRVFTIETPSELGIAERAVCQAAFIEAALELLKAEHAGGAVRAGKARRSVAK